MNEGDKNDYDWMREQEHLKMPECVSPQGLSKEEFFNFTKPEGDYDGSEHNTTGTAGPTNGSHAGSHAAKEPGLPKS